MYRAQHAGGAGGADERIGGFEGEVVCGCGGRGECGGGTRLAPYRDGARENHRRHHHRHNTRSPHAGIIGGAE